jgi:hypothetical protein
MQSEPSILLMTKLRLFCFQILACFKEEHESFQDYILMYLVNFELFKNSKLNNFDHLKVENLSSELICNSTSFQFY